MATGSPAIWLQNWGSGVLAEVLLRAFDRYAAGAYCCRWASAAPWGGPV
jgi:hypothetical protein